VQIADERGADRGPMLSRQGEPVEHAIRGVVRQTCHRPQAVALDQQGQSFESGRARATQGLEERMLVRAERASARRAVEASLDVAERLDVAGSHVPVIAASRVVAPSLFEFHDPSPPDKMIRQVVVHGLRIHSTNFTAYRYNTNCLIIAIFRVT
jgi:hypothetical protein